MIMKTAVFLAAGAALSLSAGGPESVLPGARPGEKYLSEGNYFKCVLPKDWRKAGSMGQPASEKKVYGVDIVGPAGADGISPSISVKYYAKGNALFKSAAEFIRIHSRPIPGLGLPGDKYGPITAIKLAGRSASAFERNKSGFAGPRQVENKEIPVFERYLVLPVREGFYALSYYSAASEAEAGLPVFEGVVKSFEPLVK